MVKNSYIFSCSLADFKYGGSSLLYYIENLLCILENILLKMKTIASFLLLHEFNIQLIFLSSFFVCLLVTLILTLNENSFFYRSSRNSFLTKNLLKSPINTCHEQFFLHYSHSFHIYFRGDFYSQYFFIIASS